MVHTQIMPQETVFIGFGSNRGDRQDFCDRALALMQLLPGSHVVSRSSYYETEPVGARAMLSSTWFYNGVVCLKTSLAPKSLLEICQETERSLGRDDETRHGPRTIDLDILFYGQQIIDQPGMTIPHPRLHLRRFVLVPFVELSPTWNHPTFNRSTKDLLDHLTDSNQVKKLDLVPGSKYKNLPIDFYR